MNCRRQSVRVRATTRSIHQGASLRKISLCLQKGNRSLYDDEENNEIEDEGDIKGDEYDEGDEGEENKEDEEDEGNQSEGVESVGQEDGGAHPFILLLIWTVNDFYPKITDKVFNTLQDRYQILENIPFHLPKKILKVLFREDHRRWHV